MRKIKMIVPGRWKLPCNEDGSEYTGPSSETPCP